MGGCASKPKDLDHFEPAPVEAPAATVEKPESETVPQENDGGETKKEEPLVDLSEPTEAPKKEETAEEIKHVEQPTESKAEEPKLEAAATTAAAEAVAEPEKKPELAPAPALEATTTTATKPNEAQSSDDKSDAPLVTL